MLRSIGAVFTGFLAWSVLWLVGNNGAGAIWPDAFDADGLTTNTGILAGILGFSILLNFISGWLTARIAARSKFKHALVTGALLLLVGIAVQASVWDAMPLWYHVPFLAAIVPANLIGARMAGSVQREAIAPLATN